MPNVQDIGVSMALPDVTIGQYCSVGYACVQMYIHDTGFIQHSLSLFAITPMLCRSFALALGMLPI